MNGLIAGNLCSLMGMGADVVSASQKSAKGVLWVQTLGQVLYTLSCLFLKGYSAVVQHAISVVRNLAAIYGVQNKAVEWGCVGSAVVLGLFFNNRGIISFSDKILIGFCIFFIKGAFLLLPITFNHREQFLCIVLLLDLRKNIV